MVWSTLAQGVTHCSDNRTISKNKIGQFVQSRMIRNIIGAILNRRQAIMMRENTDFKSVPGQTW
jgi:hypothetical protein